MQRYGKERSKVKYQDIWEELEEEGCSKCSGNTRLLLDVVDAVINNPDIGKEQKTLRGAIDYYEFYRRHGLGKALRALL